MFEIPQHLQFYDDREQKKFSQTFENRECYYLESTFLKPIFRESDKIKVLSIELSECETKYKFTKLLKDIFFDISEVVGLEKNIKFAFNSKKNNYISYYHQYKDSVFINRSLYESVFNQRKENLESVSNLIYTLIHELAHAKVDKLFSSDGIHIHDYFFMACLLENIKQFTGINLNDILNHKVELPYRTESKIYNLEEYAQFAGIMSTLHEDEFYLVDKFHSIEKLKIKMIKLSNETLFIKDNKDCFDNFNIHKANIAYFHKEDNDTPFAYSIFYFYKLNGFYFLYEFKQLKYKLRHFENYITYLIRIKNFLERKKS